MPRVDATDKRVSYVGLWTSETDAEGRQVRSTANAGDLVTFRWRGTSLQVWAGHPGGYIPDQCMMEITVGVDETLREKIIWKCGGPEDVFRMVYDRQGLADTDHFMQLNYWAGPAPLRIYYIEHDGVSPGSPLQSSTSSARQEDRTQSQPTLEPSPTTVSNTSASLAPSTSQSLLSLTSIFNDVNKSTSITATDPTSTPETGTEMQTAVVMRFIHTLASDPSPKATGTLDDSSNANPATNHSKRTPTIVGAILGSLFALGAVVLIVLCLKRRRRQICSRYEGYSDQGETGSTAALRAAERPPAYEVADGLSTHNNSTTSLVARSAGPFQSAEYYDSLQPSAHIPQATQIYPFQIPLPVSESPRYLTKL